MKPSLPLFVLILGLAISSSGLHAADSAPPSSATLIPPERVELKVLEVFSTQDNGHVSRAYRVEWKGQPAIATDSLVKTDYRVGDMVTVLVMKLPHPDKSATSGLLRFSVMAPRPQ